MTKVKDECPRYFRLEGEKTFFFDFVMSVKQKQEEGGLNYYDELLNLFLDIKDNQLSHQLSIRINEISDILNIENPFSQDNNEPIAV